MSMHPISPQFQALLKEFASAQGMSVPAQMWGVEFLVNNVGVLVSQDPSQADHFWVSVQLLDVTQLTPPLDDKRLILLHQINDAARLAHGWMVTISADHWLQIHCSHRVANTTAQQLESLMVEGVERGESLLELLRAQAVEAMGNDATESSLPDHFIRG
jgi:hypothetical protein